MFYLNIYYLTGSEEAEVKSFNVSVPLRFVFHSLKVMASLKLLS